MKTPHIMTHALVRAAMVLGLAGLVACGSEPQVRSLSLTPATAIVEAGQQQAFQAEATFEDGSKQDVTQDAFWMASDTKLATVTQGGVLTARKAGAVTVSARYGGQKATTEVTVTAAPVTEVTLDTLAVESEDATVAKGTTTAFTLTGTYSDGSEKDLTAQATWTVADADVAALVEGSTGHVKGLAEGSTKVTATFEGQSAEATLTVTAAELVELLPFEAPVTWVQANGTPLQLAAMATFTDGSTQDVSLDATWTVTAQQLHVPYEGRGEPPDVVRIFDGAVAGNYAGTATVAATYGGQTVSLDLTVHEVSMSSHELDNFHTFGAGLRKQVTLKTRVAGPVPAETLFRWKVVLRDELGEPVAGVKFFYPASGPEAEAAHTEWTGVLETDAQGVTYWGPAEGFTLAAAGLLEQEGVTTAFSALLPAVGTYDLDLALVELQGEAVFATAPSDWRITAATAAVAIDGLRGAGPLQPEVRTLVTVTGQLPADFDAGRRLRWRMKVSQGIFIGGPVQGVQAYYRTTEEETADHSTWAASIVTDETGTAWFGPEAGFTATEAGLNAPAGKSTPFSVWVPTPTSGNNYLVEVALVDLADDTVLGATQVSFTVSTGILLP